MNQKFNAIVGVLLLLSFLGTFATGYFHWQMQFHKPLALSMLILVIVHVMTFWGVMAAAFKNREVKSKKR